MKLSNTLWAIQIGDDELWQDIDPIPDLFPTRQQARDALTYCSSVGVNTDGTRVVKVKITVVEKKASQ